MAAVVNLIVFMARILFTRRIGRFDSDKSKGNAYQGEGSFRSESRWNSNMHDFMICYELFNYIWVPVLIIKGLMNLSIEIPTSALDRYQKILKL